jgi:hypothetical protein
MHDLARRPLAGRRPPIQFFVGGADQRFGDHPIAVLVLIDELLSRLCIHT